MTKKIIEEILPISDARLIKDLLAETTEAVTVIMVKGPLPLGSFYDTADNLHMVGKGGSLTMRQLLQILYNLTVVRNVVTFLKSDLPEIPIIRGMGEVLAVHKNLEEDIDRCIISEDEMADSASSELRNVRRSIIRQNEAIRAKMNQILNSSDNKSLLQDAIVTMRQGRYVIPVKLEHKGRFPGIVHDQSASGSTLFIEPQVIVNLNNELRELELAEKVEIERILVELSMEVANHYLDLLNNQELLVKLDLIFAKGKLSKIMHGEEAIIREDGILKMQGARHPLIDPQKVVPINVAIGEQYDTLVITGPNTGGKTVTLKTVGLLAMMTQSGLHIPVNAGTQMPVFQKIFADIGDEQSIEQSLSTFSSHMNNIVDIVKDTDWNTLVLLDELGAGTDPTEGAALAIAVLEDLYSKGAKTIATTHYTELKKYAIATVGVENASMEFNVETLSPTYKLSVGIPGKSNAFEISEKLGLDTKIIEKARRLLASGDIKFEEVISALEADKKMTEAERDEAIFINLAMKKQKEELDKEMAKMKAQKEKFLENARSEARDIIKEAKEISTEVQRELKELSKLESMGERNKEYDDLKRTLKEAETKYRDTLVIQPNHNPVKADQLRIGDRVKVLTLDQNGEVLTLPDDKQDLFVQVGLLKVNVNIENLMRIEDGKKKSAKAKTSKYGSLYKQKVQTVGISINVQGENLDNAIMDVDKYLDDAYMASLSEVTIIHGRGEGILRNGLHEMFKKHKHVGSFRKGCYNEGGDGVTIVQLK